MKDKKISLWRPPSVGMFLLIFMACAFVLSVNDSTVMAYSVLGLVIYDTIMKNAVTIPVVSVIAYLAIYSIFVLFRFLKMEKKKIKHSLKTPKPSR